MKEKKQIKNITVTEDQLHWMFRYCLSRKSYAVADGADAIIANWRHISLNGKQMIKKEINNVYDMLTEGDRATWATVLALDIDTTEVSINK